MERKVQYEDFNIGDLVGFETTLDDHPFYYGIIIQKTKDYSNNGCLWGYWHHDLKVVIAETMKEYPEFKNLKNYGGLGGYIKIELAILLKPKFLLNYLIR